jgi:hypothetical protein
MEEIDVAEYFQSVERNLSAIGSIFSMVYKKQARDLGIGEKASPKEIDALVDRVSSAMEFFVGSNMKKTIRSIMRQELRRHAPEYFLKKYGI